jgi:riboflavin transporter FmnP
MSRSIPRLRTVLLIGLLAGLTARLTWAVLTALGQPTGSFIGELVSAFVGGAMGTLAFILLSALPAQGRWSRAIAGLVSPPFGRKAVDLDTAARTRRTR